MTKITRRDAVATLTGTLLLVAVVRADSVVEGDLLPGKQEPFKSKKWAESIDDAAVGRNADFDSLGDRISTFFGTSKGRYLADQVVDLETALPGWETRERSIYEQFATIFRGAPEFEAALSSGHRMVVRVRSNYRAAVFLDSSGNIDAAGLTFDYCPPGGVDQRIADRTIHTECLWPFSAVLFHRTRQIDPVVKAAFRSYLTSLPMVVERSQAAQMSPDGKIRIKIFGRHLG